MRLSRSALPRISSLRREAWWMNSTPSAIAWWVAACLRLFPGSLAMLWPSFSVW